MTEPQQRGPARRLLRLGVTIGLNVALLIIFAGWIEGRGDSLSLQVWTSHSRVWIYNQYEGWTVVVTSSNRPFTYYFSSLDFGKAPTFSWLRLIGLSNGFVFMVRHLTLLFLLLILQALHHRRLIKRLVGWQKSDA